MFGLYVLVRAMAAFFVGLIYFCAYGVAIALYGLYYLVMGVLLILELITRFIQNRNSADYHTDKEIA